MFKVCRYIYIHVHITKLLHFALCLLKNKDKFGKDKTIWMTEYNWGLGKFNESTSYSVLHAMFSMSYISAAICDITNTMEMLMLHEYSTQDGTGWGPLDSVSFNPGEANKNDGARFDVSGQLLAELSYVAMMKNNQMYCLDIKETGKSNQQCPRLSIEVQNKKNLQCLYGAGFNNKEDVNSFGFMIVNACHEMINIELELETMIGKLNKNVSLDSHQYGYDSDGGDNSKFTNCGSGNIWVGENCVAVKPIYKSYDIGVNENSLSMNINAMSVIIANTP